MVFASDVFFAPETGDEGGGNGGGRRMSPEEELEEL